MNTIKIEKKQVRMVAHRGVSKLERENTYAAFVAAGNRSYWGVETDVRTTADGHFIILHDENTARVSGKEGLVPEKSTLAQLREVRLLDMDGNPGNEALCLPTLEEYILVCKRYEKECVLELKTEMDEATTKAMLDRIEALGYLDHVTFISFIASDLVHVKALCPEARAQFLFGSLTEEIFDFVKQYHLDVDVHHAKLTKEEVRRYHTNGIEVNCWTVDDPTDAARLIEWGVDYITSNILE